jgi:autotransporter-associated beta strand protein
MAETVTSAPCFVQICKKVIHHTTRLTPNDRPSLPGAGLFLVLLLSTALIADDYATWNYSQPVHLNTTAGGANIPGNVLKFPILVRLHPGNFQFFSQTQPGGADIRFAKTDGTHLLFEIERWVDNTGDVDTAEIWVKLDTVYGNNATQSFVMYWGKAGAADSSASAKVFETAGGFNGVWHFPPGSSPADTFMDASGSNGGINNGSTYRGNGAIGYAREFDGTSQWVEIPSPATDFKYTNTATFSAWIYSEGQSVCGNVLSRQYGTGLGSVFNFGIRDNTAYMGPNYENFAGTLTTGQWVYLTAVKNGSTEILYVNGNVMTTFSGQPNWTCDDNEVVIGADYNSTISPGDFFDGGIDELRSSGVARSADWVKLCYENQKAGQVLVGLPQQLTWDISVTPGIQAGSGTWGSSNYWTASTGDGTVLTPWSGTGNVATFTGTDGTELSYSITVTGIQKVDSLAFLSNGYGLLGGSAIDLGAKSGVYVAPGKKAFIGTPVNGSAGLTKTGSGMLIITGNCTYTGSTTVSEGALSIGQSGTSGAVNGNILNNDTLYFDRSDDIVFPGAVSGTGRLNKIGAGLLTLTGNVTHTGGTYNNSGAGLSIGNGGASGSISGDIFSDYPVVFNRSNAYTYNGVISGTGTVTKSGPGALTLTAVQTYTGNTTVAAGSLLVNGGITSGSSVTVATDAVLGGTGSLNGPVTVQDGATVVPGSGGQGKLSTGNLTFTAFAVSHFDLGTISDTLVVNGDLILDGILNVNALSGFGAGVYRLITYSGALTDNVMVTGTVPGGFTYSISAGGGVVDLTVSAVPACQWVGGGVDNRWNTSGNWSGSIVPTSTDSVIFSSASFPCSLDVDVTVRCLMFEPGYTQNFFLNGKKLTVNKDLSVGMSVTIISNGSDTICFDGYEPGIFSPKTGDVYPMILRQGSGVTTVSTEGFRTTGLLVTGGEFNFGAGVSDTVDGLLQVAGGAVNFSTCTLTVSGEVDFTGATAVVPGGGILNFNAVSAQTLYPGYEMPHPKILHSGSGILTVRNNRLRTWKLDIQGGSVVFDTALFADTVSVMSTTMLQLNTAAGNRDTIKYLSGYGDLNFGKTELFTSSSLQLNMFSSVSGIPVVSFFGSGSSDFEPKSGFQMEKISKWGSGTLRVGMYGLMANTVRLEEGILNWYTSGIDTVYDSIVVNGGLFKLSTAEVHAGMLRLHGGAFNFDTGKVVLSGGGGNIDFSSLISMSADSGRLEFSGNGSALYTLFTGAGQVLPVVTVNGTAFDTLRLASNLQAKSVYVQNSVLEWGNGFSHTVDSISTAGGTMDFGSSVISVPDGDADFSGLGTVIPGTGSLIFSGSSGIRYLTPASGFTLPSITKSGTDTLMISAYPLTCAGLTVNDGVFDFGGRNVSVNGDLTFANGTDTMVNGLDGITIAVNGNASFTGKSGSLLNLAPISAWNLSVTTGTLQADYAVIKNCNASGGVQGEASINCTDAGNNTYWNFAVPDVTPPDNPMTLQVSTVSTTDIEVIWTPSSIAAYDADSVGLWYKTTDFPDSANDVTALHAGTFFLTDSVQTITALSPHSLYYFAAAVADTAGNWSAVNTAIDTDYTYADPPTVATPLTVVHSKNIPLTWNNPAGLSFGDSIYIHFDSVPTLGWFRDTTLDYLRNSCTVALPYSSEGTYRVMISTSWDSAGLHHLENVLIDTFDFSVDPPVMASPPDTTRSQQVTLSWTNPTGLTPSDLVYLHSDTVNGASWNLAMTLPWTTANTSFDLQPIEGVYKFMLSTSLDSMGFMDTTNRVVDTVVFSIEPPVITTPFDSTESLSPNVSWTEPAGMTGSDSYFVYDDTVTGAWGWTFRGKLAYPSTGATLSYGRIGTYIYRVTTSFDSASSIEMENGAIDTIAIVDTTKPYGVAISIIDNNGYTNDNDPPVTIVVTGADSMRLGLDTDTASAVWKVYSSSDSLDISVGGDGTKRVRIQFADSIGNRSAWYMDSTRYDTNAPNGTVAFEDNNGYTNKQEPHLAITASGADSMRIGTGSDTVSAIWKSFSAKDSVVISDGGEGIHYVFIQFKDLAGNRSPWNTDSCVYDTTTPTGAGIVIADVNGYTTDPDPLLSLLATSADSMRVAEAADTAVAAWVAYASTDSIDLSISGDGAKLVFVQFKDAADNRTGWVYDSTFLDATVPSGTIAFGDRNGFTNDIDPVIAVVATGVDSMRIGLAADTASLSWKNYNPTDSVSISVGGEGVKRVYAQFKDLSGNLSAWVTDSTVYDTTMPAGSIATKGIFNYLNWQKNVSGSSSDVLSGIDTSYITITRSADGLFWNSTGWQSASFSIVIPAAANWKVPLADSSMEEGVYNVVVSIVDRAGNITDSAAIETFTWYKRPLARFTAVPSSGVAPLTVVFTDSSEGTVISRYWNLGDSAADTATQLTHVYQNTGTYMVEYIISGPGGNDTLVQGSCVIVVDQPPVARGSVTPLGGNAPVQIQAVDSSSGSITARVWTFGDGASDTVQNPVHTYSVEGTFPVTLQVWGPGGTDTVTVGTVLVRDTVGPQPLDNMAATAVNCSTLVVQWSGTSSADADSVSISISFNGYAKTPRDGDHIYRVPIAKMSDTVSGLPPEGITLFIRTFIRDSSGNWSDTSTEASTILTLPDGAAPAYSLTVSPRSVGDSTVTISVKVDSTAEKGLLQWIGFGSTRQQATDSLKVMKYLDTILTTVLQRKPGWRYIASAVEDSSGNRTGIMTDSCMIQNTAPVITVNGDTLLGEDTVWSATVAPYDFNGDPVTLSITEAPQSMTLSNGILNWTPGDEDIGSHRILITAADSHNGATTATLQLTVENREEAPVITFTGDTVVDEDVLWKARLTVIDPDPDDSVMLNFVSKPDWMKVTLGELSGTPAEKNIGIDTLLVVVSDRTGLKDTLIKEIQVRNVNDVPSVASWNLPDTLFEKNTAVANISIDDPDADDSLMVMWETPVRWITTSIPVRNTATGQWTVGLSMAPQQRDTGTVRFSVTFTDRAGAAVTVSDSIRVIDVNDPPTPPKISRSVATGAVAYTCTSADDYDSLLIYSVILRSFDDTTWFRSDRSSNGVFKFYPLADGSYRFSVIAIDQQGLGTQPVADTLTISGSSRRIFTDTSWSMIGVPGPCQVSDLEQTSYLLHWDESISERQVYHYYLRKEEITELSPGYGYWRKGNGNDTVVIEQPQLLRTPVKVSLANKVSGWNQIASPYPYPVIWRGKSSVLWKWNPESGDFEESDSILEPWAGYWIQSDATDSVTIDTVPYFANKKLAKRRKVWFNNQNEWVLRAVLTTDEGTDAENSFGFTPQAKDGYDRLDRLEPPRLSGSGSLYFPRSGWKRGMAKYASDIRRKWDAVNMFELGISGTSRSGTGKVHFEGLDRSIPLHLFVTTGDSFVAVDPEKGFTVPMTGTDSYRTLVVVDNVAALQHLPLRFSMGKAYPNPFCPSTRLHYVLPYRWTKDGKMVTGDYEVAIELFDIMGRKIRTLVHRKMRPGSYQVYWDGKSSSGRIVASGQYYCRLTAAPFNAVRKMTLVR